MWAPGQLRGLGVSLDRILGGPSSEPFFRGGGDLTRGLHQPLPPKLKARPPLSLFTSNRRPLPCTCRRRASVLQHTLPQLATAPQKTMYPRDTCALEESYPGNTALGCRTYLLTWTRKCATASGTTTRHPFRPAAGHEWSGDSHPIAGFRWVFSRVHTVAVPLAMPMDNARGPSPALSLYLNLLPKLTEYVLS